MDPKRSRIAQQLDVPSRIGKVYFPAVGDAVEIVAKFGLITHHVGKRGVIVEKEDQNFKVRYMMEPQLVGYITRRVLSLATNKLQTERG